MQERERNFPIIQVLYPGLMLYYVFTLTETIFPMVRKVFQMDLSSDALIVGLSVLFWLSMLIQVVLAYSRGVVLYQKSYPTKALVSDCIDIVFVVYVSTIVVELVGSGGFDILKLNTLHLTIPFFFVSINQMWWFKIMNQKDVPAKFRMCFLFFTMLVLTVLGLFDEGQIGVYMGTILCVLVCMVFRVINQAPQWFWHLLKKESKIRRRIKGRSSSKSEKTRCVETKRKTRTYLQSRKSRENDQV